MQRRKKNNRKGSKKRTSWLWSLWSWLVAHTGGHALWTGVFILFGVYVAFFYFFVISPYTLRWRGIYDDAVVPGGYSIRGIDVSHHQGEIDWEQLRHEEIGREPISFVFVKATEGRAMVDRNFKENFEKARENGFIRGAYHYFLPRVSAQDQAEHFMSEVELEQGDLPPVLDIEVDGGLTAEALRDSALVWLRMMKRKYGVRPILYTYYNFKQEYLSTREFEEYPYWIAHYYVDTLHYNGAWKFWQHTDRGRLDGIQGYVDLNCYNGSMYDLQQLTIGAEKERK